MHKNLILSSLGGHTDGSTPHRSVGLPDNNGEADANPASGPGKSRRIAPYSWLGVSAVGVGLGAALAGAALTSGPGIAAADTGTDTHVSSPAPAREG